jgi:hypothetical protein
MGEEEKRNWCEKISHRCTQFIEKYAAFLLVGALFTEATLPITFCHMAVTFYYMGD